MAKKKATEHIAEETGKKKGVGHLIATIIGIILCVILLPIVIVNMTLVIKSYVKPDEVPTFLGVAPLIVQSGSMHPTIDVDDLVFTKTTPPENITAGLFGSENPGTVVAYLASSTGPVITHRVIAIETDENGKRLLTLQGDANNTPDQNKVGQDQLIGTYFFRLKGAGKVALFMKEPIGMVLFVGIPLGLFVLYDAIRRALYSKKQRKIEQARIAALEGAEAKPVEQETGERFTALPPEIKAEPTGEKAAGPKAEGESDKT